MDRLDTRSQQEEQQGEHAETNREGHGRPGEKESRWRGVVALIRKSTTVPLVPFVTETAIHVDVNQLCPGYLSHGQKIISFRRCCLLRKSEASTARTPVPGPRIPRAPASPASPLGRSLFPPISTISDTWSA